MTSFENWSSALFRSASDLGFGKQVWRTNCDGASLGTRADPPSAWLEKPLQVWNCSTASDGFAGNVYPVVEDLPQSRMRIWNVRTKNLVRNFEYPPSAWTAYFAIEPRRECEVQVPAMCSKTSLCYRTSARMRISSASQVLDRHSLL